MVDRGPAPPQRERSSGGCGRVSVGAITVPVAATTPTMREVHPMTFRIGKNFHIIHMTDDVRELNLWYYDVFAVRQFMPEGYMAAEKRDASLVLIGELCVEPLAPAFRVPGWEDLPLGR